MSSMRRAALFIIPALLGTAALASTKPLNRNSAPATPAAAAPAALAASATAAAALQAPAQAQANIDWALADWRRLRGTGNFSFADYARFLINNPGWPGESTMRRNAERAMQPGENPSWVLMFFQKEQPATGNGFARLADALAASGRTAEAVQAARRSWASADLNASNESSVYNRFGSYFTAADHDRRADALLFARRSADAQRILGLVSPQRRAAFMARIAMQTRDPNTEALMDSVAPQMTTDAGLLMDRLRYYRDGGGDGGARQLAARPHNFTHRPADPERWLEMLLALAQGAANDRQHLLAYNIASQVDDIFDPGTDLTEQSFGIRDKYTSLTWLAGTAASSAGRPAGAVAMFERYSRGGRSAQVTTKGYYWAGRSAIAAGRLAEASAYFQRAAAFPETFYGQLALERMGRPVPAPGALPTFAVTPQRRAEFASRSVVRAVRHLGQQGRRDEQALFVRSLAESLTNDAERVMAVELSQHIGRQDLAVWVGRAARNNGSAFYVQDVFPRLNAQVPRGQVWSLVHGIARQESSFDRTAVSHAGARGILQLMPATAREQAGKMGYGYDQARLMSDPAYNVMLGSAYFQRMLNTWGGNVPLAVASYNAGAGNVRRWVNNHGDPRQANVDILNWIERIPFSETRGYVQRVIENSVVYDQMNPDTPSTAVHVSHFLGKTPPG